MDNNNTVHTFSEYTLDVCGEPVYNVLPCDAECMCSPQTLCNKPVVYTDKVYDKELDKWQDEINRGYVGSDDVWSSGVDVVRSIFIGDQVYKPSRIGSLRLPTYPSTEGFVKSIRVNGQSRQPNRDGELLLPDYPDTESAIATVEARINNTIDTAVADLNSSIANSIVQIKHPLITGIMYEGLFYRPLDVNGEVMFDPRPTDFTEECLIDPLQNTLYVDVQAAKVYYFGDGSYVEISGEGILLLGTPANERLVEYNSASGRLKDSGKTLSDLVAKSDTVETIRPYHSTNVGNDYAEDIKYPTERAVANAVKNLNTNITSIDSRLNSVETDVNVLTNRVSGNETILASTTELINISLESIGERLNGLDSAVSQLTETCASLVTRIEALEGNNNSGGGTNTGGGDNGDSGNTTPVETTNWYVGQVTKTKSEFSQMSDEQLVAASTALSTSTKTVNFSLNNSCMFCMIPTTHDIYNAGYTDGGIRTTYSEQEIKSGFGTNVTHEDVVIDNVTYKVYVHRSSGFIGSNIPAWFTIK